MKLQKKIINYIKENERLLAKYKIKSRVILQIPKSNFLTKLALLILRRQKASIDTQFTEIK